jgi:hypothetical protein
MGLAGALKKYPPPPTPYMAGERPGLDGALANGVEQVLSMSSSMARHACRAGRRSLRAAWVELLGQLQWSGGGGEEGRMRESGGRQRRERL